MEETKEITPGMEYNEDPIAYPLGTLTKETVLMYGEAIRLQRDDLARHIIRHAEYLLETGAEGVLEAVESAVKQYREQFTRQEKALALLNYVLKKLQEGSIVQIFTAEGYFYYTKHFHPRNTFEAVKFPVAAFKVSLGDFSNPPRDVTMPDIRYWVIEE